MKLIYVMDPLCGWCYGNSINTKKLYSEFESKIEFEILPAGMWTGNQAKRQDKNMVSFFEKGDKQIEQYTGTPFGEAYFEFLKNETIILDSEIPSRAIVSVKNIAPQKAIPFALEVQKARYMFGKDLNNVQTYVSICETLSIDATVFVKTFSSEELKKQTQESFTKATKYASSYPTLLLEKDGELFIVEQGYAPFSKIVETINQIIK
ncbi:DsbA family protein [Thalassobellus citreus]|uniref:DsbA family protein n=1 Tax=Thalassobellus citreus TaxID=3367752 RepID=UPI00379C5475